jgi:hypothetical protein
MTRFRWTDRELQTNLDGFDAKANRAIETACQYHATRAESYARTNAPWTDRTSNARNGLQAKASRAGSTHRITVSHSVPYGIFLEVRNSGKYAILRPTVDHEGPELVQTLQQLFAAMGASR